MLMKQLGGGALFTLSSWRAPSNMDCLTQATVVLIDMLMSLQIQPIEGMSLREEGLCLP